MNVYFKEKMGRDLNNRCHRRDFLLFEKSGQPKTADFIGITSHAGFVQLWHYLY